MVRKYLMVHQNPDASTSTFKLGVWVCIDFGIQTTNAIRVSFLLATG
jgi:hypothetical protein